MDLPGVSIADTGDSSMFSLSTIKKQKVRRSDVPVNCSNVYVSLLAVLGAELPTSVHLFLASASPLGFG